MTFTRITDSETLTPLAVVGPYENTIDPRTIVVPLMESSNVRVVYTPTGLRTGTLVLLFTSYAAARAGAAFFGHASSYNFDGPVIGEDYSIVDDVIVSDTLLDDTYDMRFVVAGDVVRIAQRLPVSVWELHVPFHELVEEA